MTTIETVEELTFTVVIKDNIILYVFYSVQTEYDALKQQGDIVKYAPITSCIVSGHDVRMYNEDWTRKPLQECIDLGYLNLEEDEKILNEQIVKLSDKELVEKGLLTLEDVLPKHKENKLREISQAFENEFIAGKFFSKALNIEVDYRRSGTKNDLQNVEKLISYMERNSITETVYAGYGDSATEASLSKIKALQLEMEDYGIYIYNKKWALFKQVSLAKTLADLAVLAW